MTIEAFEKLKKIIEKDLDLTEENMADKSLKIPILYTKYLDIYSKELKILKDKTLDRDKFHGDLYHKIKFEGEYKLDYAKEVEIYCNRDDELYKKNQEIIFQTIVVKHIEEILETIKSMGYTVKNYIEWRKFLAGG